jgi:hypothetical protein
MTEPITPDLPETLAWLRQSAAVGAVTSQVLVNLLERVEALEARPIPGTYELAAPTPEAAPWRTTRRLEDELNAANRLLAVYRKNAGRAEAARLRLQNCPTHGQQPINAWGCPECVRELRQEDERLRELRWRWAQAQAIAADRNGRPAAPPAPAPESPTEALAARPLLEKVARLGDVIGQQTVAQVRQLAEQADAWLRDNPPGQPVAIEPRGCPTPGACSCVEPTPPEPEVGEAGELVADLNEIAQILCGMEKHHWAARLAAAAALLQQLSAPAPVVVPVAVEALPFDELREIGHRLRTQDNRYTADPIFHVRGLRRIYGMDPAYAGTPVWIDTEDETIEVEPPADPENPGDFVIKTAYQDSWEVIMTAFSERACLDYIERNGHRHSSYQKLDVYADSLYRCPEMITIRNWLMAIPLPQAEEGEAK